MTVRRIIVIQKVARFGQPRGESTEGPTLALISPSSQIGTGTDPVVDPEQRGTFVPQHTLWCGNVRNRCSRCHELPLVENVTMMILSVDESWA